MAVNLPNPDGRECKDAFGSEVGVACQGADDNASKPGSTPGRQPQTCTCGHAADWHSNGGAGDCEHDGECKCRSFTALVCVCSDVDDSDGSASAEDNPECPIHGWDDADEDPSRISQWEEDVYLYGI